MIKQAVAFRRYQNEAAQVLFPCGAPAAATSPYRSVKWLTPFSNSYPISLLLNLTQTTSETLPRITTAGLSAFS